MKRGRILILAFALGLLNSTVTWQARAALTLLGQFSPGLGSLVGLAFDHSTDTVCVYGDFDADIRRFTRTGTPAGTIARPGEIANDADLEVAPEDLSLNGTNVPSGTLLMINGETGVADIYAIATNNSVMASLATAFGVSHVVGGSYHPARDTFFLVQDRVPAAVADRSIVAEINPTTGAVLNSFKIDTILPTFTVNFGDIEVGANGNLFVVSSDETSIAEFTPGGSFVQTLALPVGVSDLSGIGMDEARGEAWVCSSSGTVWRLGGLGCGSPVPIQLAKAGTNVVLTWSGNFTLQAASAVEGAYTNVPGATSPYTNAIQSSQRFFRLICP